VRLILDLPWTSLPGDRDEVFELLPAVLGSPANRDLTGAPILVGVGVADREETDRLAAFREVTARAHALGLPVDVHTGERTTAAEHRETVRTLAPDRVSHVMSGFCPEVARSVPINFCPLASVYVGVAGSRLGEHPLRHLPATARRTMRYSISCDDPLLFGLNLTLEFVALRRAFGWDESDVIEVMERSRDSAFFPPAPARAGGSSERPGAAPPGAPDAVNSVVAGDAHEPAVGVALQIGQLVVGEVAEVVSETEPGERAEVVGHLHQHAGQTLLDTGAIEPELPVLDAGVPAAPPATAEPHRAEQRIGGRLAAADPRRQLLERRALEGQLAGQGEPPR
jgi:hypothetical protein